MEFYYVCYKYLYIRYSFIDIFIVDFEVLKCFSFVYSINFYLKISYLLVLFS